MKTVSITIDLPVERLGALQEFLLEKEEVKPAKKPVKKEEPVPVPETPAVVTPPRAEPIKEDAEAKQSSADTGKETKINKSMLRSKGVEITKAGKQDGLREIFKKFGANNLSSLSEEHYAEAYKLMEELI